MATKKKTRKVGRSAKTGQFVDKTTLAEKPDETIMDTVPVGEKKSLKEELESLIDGLDFRSETNRLVEAVAFPEPSRPVTIKVIENLTGKTDNPPHPTFEYWFEHNCDPDVQPMAKRYAQLEAWMVENLIERLAFRMSGGEHTNVTYYAVGIDKTGNLLGISVEAVET